MSSEPADDQVWLRVSDAGSVGAVRRAAAALATRLHLPEPRVHDLAIVSTELASNLYRHAVEGVVVVQAVRRGGQGGVELIAMDRGPGMADVATFMADGRSTSGTLGIGLGAIRRQATEFDAYSWPGAGTVIDAVVWGDGAPVPGVAGFAVAGISRPISGEEVCGDGYGHRATDEGHLQVMLCDGLGHGAPAAVAARAAETAFRDCPPGTPRAILEHVHRALAHTRGAVVTIVDVDPVREVAHFVGVGNVAGSVLHGERRRMMLAQPGIAGGPRRLTVREVEVECPAGALVVLHSDGVTDRWSLDERPGLADRTPVVVAATILRDAGVRRDDAAVLVARRQPPPGAGDG